MDSRPPHFICTLRIFERGDRKYAHIGLGRILSPRLEHLVLVTVKEAGGGISDEVGESVTEFFHVPPLIKTLGFQGFAILYFVDVQMLTSRK